MEVLPDKVPAIQYPAEWEFRIICDNVEKTVSAITEVMEKREYDLQASNISKKGNYFGLVLRVMVIDETQRNSDYEKLKGYPSIRYVL
ncbi:MAG: DUF493 domain-containing protein [Ignavibacteriales bacterium]|nr:DUF493 domain-containing protein [Ignavibacteriales bacterium]MCF8306484.1 DUF493 domain-containing protein [Ignavibacteriales bacterium]MCF8316950.1 DUF493 domain-containing protein [Ignavibacteriales bacterium]MCF8437759.1 DUF493 domain-containing protein [Ignavibacteriales bacterium]